MWWTLASSLVGAFAVGLRVGEGRCYPPDARSR